MPTTSGGSDVLTGVCFMRCTPQMTALEYVHLSISHGSACSKTPPPQKGWLSQQFAVNCTAFHAFNPRADEKQKHQFPLHRPTDPAKRGCTSADWPGPIQR